MVAPDGSLSCLRLRLPDGFGSPSQYLVLNGVCFVYGQEAILQGLSASWIITRPTKRGKLLRKREESGVSCRLGRDRRR
ncbi:hypothetical protein MPNT_320009 [Candidatus Methylacidithermus pantelleriae]|uniref:Uncharacterized protein n=1 Tax=Candidatus Methylacidithermus pantelleriae TaxID=2744239 RepID=A0A8J2BQR6_9BACT|nr:hypothetical protein MPNT_320009 [Candidatus Methylacidithermus pantelleriae]